MPRKSRSVKAQMEEHSADTMMLGTVRLHLNPSSYTDSTDRLVVKVQTAGGYGRYDYGAQPNVYTIQGSTGTDGLKGPGGIAALETMRPQAGRPDTAYPFIYPARFGGVRFVKVNHFEVDQDASQPYTYNFRLELEEYPPDLLAAAAPLSGYVLPVPLPVGG